MNNTINDQDPDQENPAKISLFAKILIFTIVFAGVSIFFEYLSLRDAAILSRQQVVPGVIESAPSGRFDTVDYRFEFQGNLYHDSESHHQELNVGDRVNVFVDSSNPSMTSLMDFRTNSEWHHGAMIMFLVLSILLAIATGIAWVIRRNQQAKINADS